MSFFGFGGKKAEPEPAAAQSYTYEEPTYDYSSPAPAASSFDAAASSPAALGGASDVQAMILEEQQRAMIQQAISKISAIAWDKCSASSPGAELSSKERDCIKNTTLAYLDTSVFVVHRLNKSG